MKYILSVLLMLGGFMSVSAQITGTVFTDEGDAAIAANIIWAGTGNGTITNESGQFEVQRTPESNILVVSYEIGRAHV